MPFDVLLRTVVRANAATQAHAPNIVSLAHKRDLLAIFYANIATLPSSRVVVIAHPPDCPTQVTDEVFEKLVHHSGTHHLSCTHMLGWKACEAVPIPISRGSWSASVIFLQPTAVSFSMSAA